MRKALAVVALTVLALLGFGTASGDVSAIIETVVTNDNDAVCPNLDTGHLSANDQTSWTITAPDGMVIVAVCVKAGSAQQGDGPEFPTVPPGSTTFTFSHSSGKEISHYSVDYEPKQDTTTTETTTTETTTTDTTTTDTTTTTETTTTEPPTTTTTTTPPTTTTETTTTTAPPETTTTTTTVPPTTTTETTTTTAPPTTTTVTETTTPPPDTTTVTTTTPPETDTVTTTTPPETDTVTTTTPPDTTTTTSTTPPDDDLPDTGLSLWMIVLGGLGGIALGLALRRWSK